MGRKGDREGEKHQCVVASHAPPTGDLAFNPGMCPGWESNRQPFGSQAGIQSTEPHQPGLIHSFVLASLLLTPSNVVFTSVVFFRSVWVFIILTNSLLKF